MNKPALLDLYKIPGRPELPKASITPFSYVYVSRDTSPSDKRTSESLLEGSESPEVLHKPSLLIFDFDGTIADTSVIVMDVGNEVLREYDMRTVPRKDYEKLRGMSSTELIRYFKVPVHKIPRIVRSIRKSIKTRIDVVQPVDGMIGLIQELNAMDGVTLAVLSSNSRENVVHFLKEHQIRDCFDEIKGDIGVFSKYTKLRRLTRSRGKGAVVIGIGDETRDIEATKIAKVKSIGVDWGLNTGAKLRLANADFVVSSVKELRRTILEVIR